MKEIKKFKLQIVQIVIAFTLGIGIVYWIYQDFDFSEVWVLLKNDTKWEWMFLSLVFGVLSHVVRGLRWRLALAPLDAYPKKRNCINAIFISYFTNMLIPRIGELSRCMVLSKYDKISFSKSLGSVVAERFVDTICISLLTGLTILLQLPLFMDFFRETGLKNPISDIYGILILIGATLLVVVLVYFIVRRFMLLTKVKEIGRNMWQGFIALRSMKGKSWWYLVYTVLLWVCYFLHFYLTFYCFDFSDDLGLAAGLSLFIVGSIAVIVPTPNGAGPWHFAIITMMTLYGVNQDDARIFALVVHSIQTFLVILLGIYGLLALPLSNKNIEK